MDDRRELLFVDTNVFVYAISVDSPWHRAARLRLSEVLPDLTCVCVSPQIIRECLVALTRPGPDGIRPSVSDAVENAVRIRTQSRLLTETVETVDALVALVRDLSVAGKKVHDANIVATMLAHGVRRLLTHNVADFERYRHLIEVVPLVP